MKMVLFGFFMVFLLGFGSLLGATQNAGGKRIATLSLQRIISDSAAGRAANQQLQALAQKMSAEVSAKQKEAQAGPAAGMESRQAELQRFIQQSQAEYANTQRQLQNDLREKLKPIVASVAAARGAELVLNADTAVAWEAPNLDVTNDVIARLAAPPQK